MTDETKEPLYPAHAASDFGLESVKSNLDAWVAREAQKIRDEYHALVAQIRSDALEEAARVVEVESADLERLGANTGYGDIYAQSIRALKDKKP